MRGNLMKIAIMGYSGSGKSTLARKLAEKHNIPVLHFDAVHFLPGWEIRSQEEKAKMTEEFMDGNGSWVIDGNYSKLSFERRVAEADEIVMLLFNRFSCFYRAYRRSRIYAGKTRPDMGVGCQEKFDLEFMQWILWKGRSKKTRDLYRSVMLKYGHKVTVIRNQKQLNAYILSKGL